MKTFSLIAAFLFLMIQSQAEESLNAFGSLYEPPALAFSFETPGWTILAVIVILLMITFFVLWIRKRIRNKYRREALREIDRLRPESEAIYAVFLMLKKVAIQVFGRKNVASLHGKDWLLFLDKTGKKVQFQELDSQIFAILYEGEKPSIQTSESILNNAKKWIKTHAV